MMFGVFGRFVFFTGILGGSFVFSQNLEKLDPWYAENLADCKKILAKEGEGPTSRDPFSDSRIFSICSNILTTRVLETPGPEPKVEGGGVGSDINTGLFYVGAAAEWIFSLGITENLVERAIRREIPKEIYEAFAPTEAEISRNVVKPMRLQLFEEQGSKITRADRATRDSLEREFQKKRRDFVEKESRKTIEKILPEVARWVVKESSGGASDVAGIRAKLTWKIALELAAKNLKELGYDRPQSLKIAERAMSRLENCLNQANALSPNSRADKAVQVCGARFSAAAPALLAESILLHEMQESLGAMLSPKEFQEISSVVRVAQIKCISSKQKPTNSLEEKVSIAKTCSMEAIASAFQTLLAYALDSKISDLTKPGKDGQAPLLQNLSPTDREKLIQQSLHDFINKEPKQGPGRAALNIPPSKLKDLHRKPSQDALAGSLAGVSVDQFKGQIQRWQNHVFDQAGKNIVEQAIRLNPDLPETLRSDAQTMDRIVNQTLAEAYTPCMQRQVEAGFAQLDPERCASIITPVASVLVASAAIDFQFGNLLGELGVSSEKIAALKQENIQTTEVCVGNLVRYLSSTANQNSGSLSEALNRRAANQCYLAGLRKYLAMAVENVVRDSVQTNPDIKAFFPDDPNEAEALLVRYGVFERARELSQNCFLAGINEIHISNLQQFLNQRKIICQSFIERGLSSEFSKIIVENLHKTAMEGAPQELSNDLKGRLASHVRAYEENFSKKSEQAFFDQLKSGFGVHAFSDPDKTAESEKKALDEISQKADQLDSLQNAQYAVSRRKLRVQMVADVTDFALRGQLEQMVSDPKLRKEIHEKVMAFAVPAQAELEKKYQSLNEIEAKILAETDSRKKIQLERDRNSIQIEITEQEIAYEGEVMHRATQWVLPVKLSESLRHEVPLAAPGIVERALEIYEECIGQKRVADSAVIIRLKSQHIARRYRMSAPINTRNPPKSAADPFSAKGVEDCKNKAVATASWLAVQASVDQALVDQLPDEFDAIKKLKPPLSRENCPIPANKYSDRLTQAYANFLCYEDSVKKCITSSESDSKPPTKPAAEKRIDGCLAKAYVKTAAPFAEIVLDKEFRKYLMLDADPEKHKNWPSPTAHNYAEFIYSVSKVSEKFKKCAEKIEIPPGETGDLATQKIKLDACAAVQVLTIARGAGYFANDAYYGLAHVKLEKRAEAYRQSAEEFSKCMNNIEKDIREKAPQVRNPNDFFEMFVQLKMDPKEVQALVSVCTAELEKKVGDYVFKGFTSRSQLKQKEVRSRFREEPERNLALARIESGFQTAVGILEASKEFSPPSKNGPTHPSVVKDSLDLVDKLVTDVCIFDENCRDTIGSLNVALLREGHKNKVIPEKRFTEIVLDSSFFEKVVLSRIQDKLRTQLESTFKGIVVGRSLIAEEMVDYLSGSRFISQRFSDPWPRDRFGKSMASGRPILEQVKKDVKAFYLDGDKSKDPNTPEFENKVSKQIESHLANDWEFLAGIFWAIAGQDVEDTPLPDGFFATRIRGAAWAIGAWESKHKMDWWGRGVRTPSGCKILKKIQKLVTDSFAGKPFPSSGPEMDKLKKEFTEAYEASVTEGVWYGSSILGRFTSEDWVEPSECIAPAKPSEEKPKQGH